MGTKQHKCSSASVRNKLFQKRPKDQGVEIQHHIVPI